MRRARQDRDFKRLPLPDERKDMGPGELLLCFVLGIFAVLTAGAQLVIIITSRI